MDNELTSTYQEERVPNPYLLSHPESCPLLLLLPVHPQSSANLSTPRDKLIHPSRLSSCEILDSSENLNAFRTSQISQFLLLNLGNNFQVFSNDSLRNELHYLGFRGENASSWFYVYTVCKRWADVSETMQLSIFRAPWINWVRPENQHSVVNMFNPFE